MFLLIYFNFIFSLFVLRLQIIHVPIAPELKMDSEMKPRMTGAGRRLAKSSASLSNSKDNVGATHV